MTALNLVAFSLEELGADVLREILRGGADAAAAAGAAVVGGHSIDDREPKYGMAVTGDRASRRSCSPTPAGAPGDALVLTKPVGAGAITTGAQARRSPAPEAVAAAVEVMTTLNADGLGAAARAAGAHAVTDVTGFGLLGHLHELAAASGVAAEVRRRRRAGDRRRADAARGRRRGLGRVAAQPRVGGTFATFDADVPEARRRLVCDAMTSGGLLVALPARRAGRRCRRRSIGRLVAGPAGAIQVRP